MSDRQDSDTNAEKQKLIESISELLQQPNQTNIQQAIKLTQEIHRKEQENTSSRQEQIATQIRELLGEGSLISLEQALKKLNEMLALAQRETPFEWSSGTQKAQTPGAPTPPPTPTPTADEPQAAAKPGIRSTSQQRAEAKTGIEYVVMTDQAIIAYQREAQEVHSVCFSNDGRRIAYGMADGGVRVYDFSDGDNLSLIGQYQGSAAVKHLTFNPANPDLMLIGYEARLSVVAFTEKIPPMLGRYESISPITAATISSNGMIIGFGNQAGMVGLMRFPEAGALQKLEMVKSARTHEVIKGIAFSPDMRKIVCGGGEGTCRLLSLLSSQEDDALPELFRLKADAAITAVSYFGDGSHIALGLKNGDVQIVLLRVEGQSIVPQIVATYPTKSPVTSLSLHPDRNLVAAGNTKGEVVVVSYLQESSSGEAERYAEYTADAAPSAVQFSPQGNAIAVGTGSDLIVLRCS